MSDADQASQALAELWDIVKCRCHEAYTGRGLHDPDCQCDSTDAVQTVADRIEALTAKLAKAEAGLLAIAKRDEQMIWGEDYEVEEAFKDMRDIACATLAAVTETHKIKSSKAAPPYGLEGESHE